MGKRPPSLNRPAPLVAPRRRRGRHSFVGRRFVCGLMACRFVSQLLALLGGDVPVGADITVDEQACPRAHTPIDTRGGPTGPPGRSERTAVSSVGMLTGVCALVRVRVPVPVPACVSARAPRASVFCVVGVGVRLVFVRVRVRLFVDAHVSVRACGYAMAWQCHCAQMRLDEAMARALMEMDEAVSQAETRAPLSEEAEADRRAQVAGGRRAGGRGY